MTAYIAANEYQAYGLPSNAVRAVSRASTLIDGFLQRPEGLLYASGNMVNTGAPIVERHKSSMQGRVIVTRSPLASVSAIRWTDGISWTTVDVSQIEFFDVEVNGKGLIPAAVMTEVTYLAGYTTANLPGIIKDACANVAHSLIQFPEILSGVNAIQAGGTRIDFGTAGDNAGMSRLFGMDTMAMLRPWRRVNG